MAFKLYITWGGVQRDYSGYVDWSTVSADESINMPSQCQFKLNSTGWKFEVPPARGYVQIYSTKYSKSLFSGFITTEPKREYLSLAQISPTANAGQLFAYYIDCTSDEHLLNIKSVPFIPAFVNQSQGDILSTLANILCPGFFDTTNVASGDIVPFFNYSPSQSWSELAKQFGDGTRYRYKARDKKLWYVPYGDQPLGVEYDEARKQTGWFKPKTLKTDLLKVPIVNDITIVGDTEAGNNREDYFLGDGFTADFPLRHKVFHGASTALLADTWNENSLNEQQWFLFPPEDQNSNFDFSAGALNIITASGAGFSSLGQCYLAMNNGLELAGGIQTQVGEVTFNDICSGVLGGIYTDDLFTDASLMAGFNITSPGSIQTSASGAAGIVIDPWFEGSEVSSTGSVTTQINHNYVLQLLVHAPKYTRYTRIYRTVEGEEFGGAENTSKGSLTWIIQDYDIAAATGFYYQPKITKSQVDNVDIPAFATYSLVNNRTLNLTLGNTVIALMPLGGLQALEGPSGLYLPTGGILPMLPKSSGGYVGPVLPWPAVGSGLILPPPLALQALPTVEPLGSVGNLYGFQAAQITQGNSVDKLSFYAQTIPAAGTPVRLQTWEAQAAVSRLQASGSIAQEAFVVGDDGIRASIVTDLNPLPRTSEDCDNAGLAFLADKSVPQYNGSYTVEGDIPYFLSASGFAVSGSDLQSVHNAQAKANIQAAVVTDANYIAQGNKLTPDEWNVYLATQAYVLFKNPPDAFPPDPQLVFLGQDLTIPLDINTWWGVILPYMTQAYSMGMYFGLAEEQFWPTPGRFLHVNAPRRKIGTPTGMWVSPPTGVVVPASGFVAQKMLVTKVKFTILDALTDLSNFEIQFGVDLHLEKVLKNFVDLQPPQVLFPSDKAKPPDPRFREVIGTVNDFIPDLNNVFVDITNITPDQLQVRVLDSLAHTQFSGNVVYIEVRRIDANWGKARSGRIGGFAGLNLGHQAADFIKAVPFGDFTLQRQQFDEMFFMRPVIYKSIHPPHGPIFLSGLTTSRRSKVIRMMYPQRPSPPLVKDILPIQVQGPSGFVNSYQIQFLLNGDVRNIYGIEVRAADNRTVLWQRPLYATTPTPGIGSVVTDSLTVDLSRTPLLWTTDPFLLATSGAPLLYPYFFNAQWDYSLPVVLQASGTAPTAELTIVEKATFGIGIGQPQAIGRDLTNHYMVRKPGFLVDCVGNAKTAPSSLPLYLEIERSTDQGHNWSSIFLLGGVADSTKLVIPTHDTFEHIQATFAPANATVNKGDWLRINLLAGSGTDAQDIEIVLRWGAPTGVQ